MICFLLGIMACQFLNQLTINLLGDASLPLTLMVLLSITLIPF